MKILHVIGDCNPAMGGAIEGVLRLGEAYRALGHEQHLLTLDSPDDPWVAQCPAPVTALGRSGARKIFYPARAVGWLQANAGRFDAVIVDGLWNAATLAARCALPGLNTPYAVFPHGMLDPWFRQQQPIKEAVKRLSFRLVERPLLRGAQAVLFTTRQEQMLASQSWPGWSGMSEQVVGFGTGRPNAQTPAMKAAFTAKVARLDARPFLLFLGRIHPKKGCEVLLEAYATQHRKDGPCLIMVGPGDPSYIANLKALAEKLDISHRVFWPGMLSGDAKWGALYGCDAMILTSYQENFGVVVAEAMACARPVIISDQVNIHDEVASAGAGLICETNTFSAGNALAEFDGLNGDGRLAMGLRGKTLFESTFTMSRVAERIIALFGQSNAIVDK